MRNPSRVLALICILSFLIPLTALADERQSKSIAQLLEDLKRLEAVANDPATQPEVREINRSFLTERRARLRQVVLVRIEALRKYRASVGDSLSLDEGLAIERSSNELASLLQSLGGGVPPSDTAAVSVPAVRTQNASFTAQQPISYDGGGTTSPPKMLLATPVLKTAGESGVASYSGSLLNRGGSANPMPAPMPVQSPTPKPNVTINVATEQLTGDKVRGPARIKLENLNILRYDIRVGRDVTFTPGPDLKLPFIPPIPGQAAKNNPGGTGGVAPIVGVIDCTTIPICFSEAVDTLNQIEGDKVTQVNVKIVDVSGLVNGAKAELESLVSASDSVLTTAGGAQTIITAAAGLVAPAGGGAGTINTALNATWPDANIETLLGRLDVLRNKIVALPTISTSGGPNWSMWSGVADNKSAYISAQARIDELRTQLNGLKSTASTQGTAFREAQNKLRLWRPILTGVRDGGVAGFTRRVDVGCGFAFDMNKETKVKIVKRDRTAESGAAPTSEEIVTVICSSPFSISAGFGFSFVDEREFAFVQSTKTVTGANGQPTETVINRFGLKNSSSFKTLPVLLLNTRIWEPNDKFSLHASAGAAVDIKSGEGGADLEYIVGPSFSFMRSFFITPGLHIGRVPKLAGGFQLGQEVPTGVTTSPIEKAWKTGFVTTFTYKIK